jgi:phage/plasmid-like protein (TIGR03299 family)
MTKETMQTLNQLQLIGFAATRGKAWHYRAEDQGAEPNHYDGAVPLEDVLRRLFNFTVDSEPLYLFNKETGVFECLPDRQAMVRSDNRAALGIFKEGYRGHQYKPWLLDNVATILNHATGLGIGSAGLLREGGVAYVQVEVPESRNTPEGVEFRPNLLATTSFDGTTATTYKRTVTVVVCDNTREAALGERGQTFKVKHTKNSGLKIADAREALQLINDTADEFAAETAQLCQWSVTEAQFQAFLKQLVPMPKDKGRGMTMAENKMEKLAELYHTDPRCAPWTKTAFGVLQAVNTYNHHESGTRGTDSRAVRNLENVVSGKFASADVDALKCLELVCA